MPRSTPAELMTCTSSVTAASGVFPGLGSRKTQGALWLDLPRYHGQWQEDAWVVCHLSRLSSFVLMP